jgi:hypothetical protein
VVVVIAVVAVVEVVALVVDVDLVDDGDGDSLLSLPPHAAAKTARTTAKGATRRIGDRTMTQSWTCARLH